MNLYLVGFMASGKSTLGRFLSEYTGRSFRDLDRLIEERAGRSIREIFAGEGEDAFRRLEAEVLSELSRADGFIVATGAGVVESEESRRILRGGFTVFLDWDWEALRPWLKKVSRHSRPLLEQDDDAVHALFEKRRPLYAEVAGHIESVGREQSLDLSAHLNRLCGILNDALLDAEEST